MVFDKKSIPIVACKHKQYTAMEALNTCENWQHLRSNMSETSDTTYRLRNFNYIMVPYDSELLLYQVNDYKICSNLSSE